jgi:enamine deaminase RidA (YjgF/YER057c/UK114 family)
MAEPRRFNPETLPPATGYSQIAEAQGRVAYISGQVAETPDGALVGKDDFAAQVEQVFANLDASARALDRSFADIVKLNIYCLASVEREELAHYRRMRDRYIDMARAPASTFVMVAGLARKSWLIEIEAVVQLD